MERKQLTDEQINNTIELVLNKLKFRLEEKGYGTFTSKHEILGVITEEYNEFVDAIHDKNYGDMMNELIDVAVGAIFGVACINYATIEW